MIFFMTLSSEYLQLMDLANQATDRQSYFHYLREAQALLLADNTTHGGVRALNQFIGEQLTIQAVSL